MGASQIAPTPGWVLMQYSSPGEAYNLNAEETFRDQAHIFILQRPQSGKVCLSSSRWACVRVENRNPGLPTVFSTLSILHSQCLRAEDHLTHYNSVPSQEFSFHNLCSWPNIPWIYGNIQQTKIVQLGHDYR